jgi:hypothetical protein
MSMDKSTSGIFFFDAVISRIKEIYGLEKDSEVARKIGLGRQDIYTYKKRKSIPFAYILENTPPQDWEFIFLGRRSARALPLREAIEAIEAQGLAVVSPSILRAAQAAQPPPEGG